MRKTAFVLLVMFLAASMVWAGGSAEKEKPKAEKPFVAFVVKTLDNPFWQYMKAGAMAAAKENNVRLEFTGPASTTDVMGQLSIIEDFVTKNVNALCVAPQQPKALMGIFEKASEKKIHVILANADAPFDKKVTFVGTDNYSAGKIGGEYLAKKLGSGGNVVLLRGPLGDPTHDERTKGFVETLEKGGCKVLDIQPADNEANKGMNVMENMMQRFPKIDGVACTNDLMALGAMRAKDQAGKKIQVLGFDGSLDAIEATIKGTLLGSVAQDPYNMGYIGVVSAAKAIRGESVNKRIDTGAYIIDSSNAEKEFKEKKAQLGVK